MVCLQTADKFISYHTSIKKNKRSPFFVKNMTGLAKAELFFQNIHFYLYDL